jgi:hypothetical protein
MKKILIIWALLIAFNVNAQTELVLGQSYVLSTPISATPWNFINNTLSTEDNKELKRGYKYTLLNITSDNQYAIIELWPFSMPDTVAPKNDSTRKETEEEKLARNKKNEQYSFTKKLNEIHYYRVSLSELSTRSVSYSGKLQPIIGIITLPVKVRFGYGLNNREFDFSKDVSLAASFAIRSPINHGLNQRYSTCVLATGFSSIALDSLSAPKLGKNLDASSFTLAIGWMYEFKTGQIGLFGGIDLLGRNKERYGWVYQGLPWFSLGIGINLFAPDNNSSGSKAQTVNIGGK